MKAKGIETTNLEKELTRHLSGDSEYTHQGTGSSRRVLLVAVALTLGYAVVEVIGGFLSNSLALLSDAGHMVTDSASLFFALLANYLAGRPASGRYSFGFAKLEVLAALLNAIAMFAVVIWIVVEAIERFSNPQPVNGSSVFIVATLGLMVNIAVAWTLSRDQASLNTRAALLHVMGDLLGSIAAITAGIVIYFGGPYLIDPILSIFVSTLILHSSWGVLKTSVHLLLDGVPENIPYQEVGSLLEQIPGVYAVHDLHIWDMTANEAALSAHVMLDHMNEWPAVLDRARDLLETKYGISHITLQPEETPVSKPKASAPEDKA